MGLVQHPFYLLLALLAAGGSVALYFQAEARRQRILKALGNPATLLRLIPGQAAERRKIRFILQAAALFFLLLAMAAPQWGIELVTNEAKGIQVLLAVDTSLSMLAQDAKPDRIGKAKNEMFDIIDALKGQRVGIVAFAGQPHVVCPLTTDLDAAKSMLDTIQVGMVPQPGTAIGDTIAMAAKLLGKYPGQKALVLFTDGEDRRGNPEAAAGEAAAAGVRIYIIGVGTPEGDPIPIKDSNGRTMGYVKDSSGKTVITKMEEASSIRIAAAAQGAYYRATDGQTEAQAVAGHILGLEKSGLESGSVSRYKNRYRLPLAVALLLMLAELLIPEGPLPSSTPLAHALSLISQRKQGAARARREHESVAGV